jgi:hypothetical protein
LRRHFLLLSALLPPLAASAQTVTINAQAARDGGVKTGQPPLIQYAPSRDAYGIVESPAAVLSLRASIIEAAAQLQLANANLKRTSQLYHAAHNVSVASLEQAQAAQAVAAAKLAALKANAAATYGSSLGQALLAVGGPVAALAAGQASLIEVNVGPPVLNQPPARATARVQGGQPMPVTLIGAAGQVPMGMLGQGFYYAGPALPSGTPLSISLPEGGARSGYAVPLSALVYHDRGASMFVETSPGRFSMVKVPMQVKIRRHGEALGYFVPERLIPRGGAIATQGAGLLLSIAAHDKAAKTPAPDQD